MTNMLSQENMYFLFFFAKLKYFLLNLLCSSSFNINHYFQILCLNVYSYYYYPSTKVLLKCILFTNDR